MQRQERVDLQRVVHVTVGTAVVVTVVVLRMWVMPCAVTHAVTVGSAVRRNVWQVMHISK